MFRCFVALLSLTALCHAGETVFFSDTFNRPDNLNLNTNSGLNQTNFLGTPVPYIEVEVTTETTVNTDTLVRLESGAVVFQPAARWTASGVTIP